jgi:hypothetical protein
MLAAKVFMLYSQVYYLKELLTIAFYVFTTLLIHLSLMISDIMSVYGEQIKRYTYPVQHIMKTAKVIKCTYYSSFSNKTIVVRVITTFFLLNRSYIKPIPNT